jgi:uncharacterized protein YcbK (DUF882 family)
MFDPRTPTMMTAAQDRDRWRARLRRRDLLLAAGIVLIGARGARGAPVPGRRLRLHNAHTGETFDGVYRDETGPIPDAVGDLTVFFRDHHAHRVGPLDIAVVDFLADVLAAVGAQQAVVLSAYRTPETNAKLAATTFGVAEHSEHIYGRALDITIETRLADAEAAARSMRRGGVGWYPRSHFIHLDSGPVRNWSLDAGGLEDLLLGRPLKRLPTVAERLKLQRAVARREWLERRR